jgi:hypothetical protein
MFDTRTQIWAARNAMPRPRFSLASASFTGEIWVVGGNRNGQPTSLVEIYRPDINTWRFAPANLTIAREGLCVGVVRGVLYAVGGWDGNNYLTSIEAYNLQRTS